MASEKVLEAKKAKVVKLTEQLQSAVSCVFVDYKGITVEQDTKLRKELREAGVHYSVEKNTMLRFALHNIGMNDFDGILTSSSTPCATAARLLFSASPAPALLLTGTR